MNQTKKSFDPTRFNTGIPTGSRNNLLVVDLDVKDDGVLEFQEYIKKFGKPQTLHVVTPTGGEHFYFNYVHPDSGSNQIIQTFLNNLEARALTSEVRGVMWWVPLPCD